jgi:hypothetical protein
MVGESSSLRLQLDKRGKRKESTTRKTLQIRNKPPQVLFHTVCRRRERSYGPENVRLLLLLLLAQDRHLQLALAASSAHVVWPGWSFQMPMPNAGPYFFFYRSSPLRLVM